MKIIIKNLIIVSYKIGINKLAYKLMYSSFLQIVVLNVFISS